MPLRCEGLRFLIIGLWQIPPADPRSTGRAAGATDRIDFSVRHSRYDALHMFPRFCQMLNLNWYQLSYGRDPSNIYRYSYAIQTIHS
jgi:hypothetical protein